MSTECGGRRNIMKKQDVKEGRVIVVIRDENYAGLKSGTVAEIINISHISVGCARCNCIHNLWPMFYNKKGDHIDCCYKRLRLATEREEFLYHIFGGYNINETNI